MACGWACSGKAAATREVGWPPASGRTSCEGFFPLADAADSDAIGLWYCAVLGLVPPTPPEPAQWQRAVAQAAGGSVLRRRLGVPPVWASPWDMLQPPAASVRVCSKISTSGSFPAADFRIALIGRMPQQLFVNLCCAPRSHDVAQ